MLLSEGAGALPAIGLPGRKGLAVGVVAVHADPDAGAEHSREVLNLQPSSLHAPTPPVMSATPPFWESFVNVSHMGCPPLPTMIAIAWHSLFLLYEQFVTSQSMILGIVIAMAVPPCENHPFTTKKPFTTDREIYFKV